MGCDALAFHKDPTLAQPPPFPLEALLVFEHRSDAELIRSMHFYEGDGMLIVVQQEFRLRPDKYFRVREPVGASYCNGFAANSSEQLRSMYKLLIKDDDPMWVCVVDFLRHSLLTTTMAPRLRVSRNSALLQLPSLAHDLQFIEKAVRNAFAETEFAQSRAKHDLCEKFLCRSSLSTAPIQISEVGDTHTVADNLWAPSEVKDRKTEKCSKKSGAAISNHEASTFDWGSDLELGSPQIQLDLSLSASIGALCSPAYKTVSSQASNLTATGNEYLGSFNYSYELKPQFNIDAEGSSISQHREVCENGSLSFDILHSGSVSWNKSDTPLFENSLNIPRRGFRLCSGSICTSTARSSLVNSDESGDSATGERVLLLDLNSEATQPTELQLPGLSQRHSNKKEQNPDSGTPALVATACQPRGPTERLMEITLEELSQYFNMPITEASRELKVGLTVLKKKCRELRIPRWPHRKLKSLDSLIHNIQELGRSTSGRSPSEIVDTIRVLEEQKRIMEDSPGLELTDRTKRLRQACFKASYKQRRQEQQLLKVELFENVHRVNAAVDPYGYTKCGLIDECTSSLKGTPFSPKLQYGSVQLMQT